MRRIALLVLLVMLVSGCSMMTNNKGAELPNPYVGEDAVSLSFVENSPPEKVVSNSDIRVGLVIKNEGAVGIEKSITVGDKKVSGVIALSLNSAYMKTASESKKFSDAEFGTDTAFLLGKDSSSVGDSRLVSFDVKVNTLTRDEYKVNPTTTILATICYPYKTIAVAPVCIDQNPYGTTEKLCEMGTVSLRGGQGAPVAVEEVEQGFSVSNNKFIPQFKIFVENVGEGKIVDAADIENACGAKEAKYNIIYLKEAKLLGKALECSAPGSTKAVLNLDSEKDRNYFLCRYSEGFEKADNQFYTDLSVELAYGYIVEKPKDVEIEVLEQVGTE